MNPKVKIGIIGPKEVGKSTLANLLTGYLKSIGVSTDLVHETARSSPFLLNDKTTIETAYWLLGAQISSETLVEATRQITICDRTVIDLYPFVICTQEPKNSQGELHEIYSIKKLIMDYVEARPYEFLFYIPIRQETWETFSKPEDPSFQAIYDKVFREFLREINISFIELEEIESYKRLDEVMTYIRKKHNI